MATNKLHPSQRPSPLYNPRSKLLAALAESIGTVSVAGSTIKLQTSIKNLGALDSIIATLSWLAHPFQISLALSMFRMLSLEWSHKHLGSATSHLFFLICIGFRFATELALKLLRLLSGFSNFSSQLILHLSSQSMYRREHSARFQFCLYVFPHVKPPSQPPNLFHLLLQISGTHCQVICHSFQLFPLLEELSNITCSCVLTRTVVRNLVRSNQLNLSRFVIHRQLLPSHSSEMPCRPSKGVSSERLRLVK